LTETVPSGVPFEASFTVEGEPRLAGEDGARWTSFASSVSGVDVRVLFQPAPGDAPPEVGDVWRCAGWLEGGRGGAGDFRRRAFWVRGRGTFARRERAADAAGWRARLAAVRRDLSRRVGIGLDAARPEIAGLNRAILLGERAHLPRATRRVFVDAGTMHVFAVSGLHVMIVAGVLRFLLVLAFVPVRLTGLALVPLLWGYVLVIGSPPSALRAAAMASVYFLAPLFWRRSDGIVAWSLTFIVFHILFPGNLLRVGSLLSFAVMLGILLFLSAKRAIHRASVRNNIVRYSAVNSANVEDYRLSCPNLLCYHKFNVGVRSYSHHNSVNSRLLICHVSCPAVKFKIEAIARRVYRTG
jgi:ComEC/Rec2-related protein